jgi:hypothetical protein
MKPGKLTEAQREELTIAVLKDAGSDAIDYIEDCLVGSALMDKVIEVLEENNMADRNVLLKEIGQMLVNTAIKRSTKQADEAIEDALSEIAYENGEISEMQQLIDDDNRQRAKDMNSQNRSYSYDY